MKRPLSALTMAGIAGLAALLMFVGIGQPHSALAQPANDNFPGAIIGALPFTDSVSTAGATTEPPDEPLPCGAKGSTVWYEFTPAADAFLQADTFGSGYDTVVAVYTGAALATLNNVDCNDDFVGLLSVVRFSVTAGVTYRIQVGGFAGQTGDLVFNLAEASGPPPIAQLEGPPGSPSCSDGLNNDGDFSVDLADSGCGVTEDRSVIESCFDGIDNDGDGLVDEFGDPDCRLVTEGPPGSSACSDGADNDFDGSADLADSGCGATEGPFPNDSCFDGVDNDGDGLVDFRGDPGCGFQGAEGPPGSSACVDGLDNDGDGAADLADSGCGTAEDASAGDSCFDGVDNDGDGLGEFGDPDCFAFTAEGPPASAACADAVDNDFDALVDAADSGCVATEGPSFFDQSCDDGVDNDGDGLVDFSGDPDCASLDAEGPPGSAVCGDGVDNDLDGSLDLADSGCGTVEGPFSDESCSDGVDNDGDGLGDSVDPDCAFPGAEGPPGSAVCSDGVDNDVDGFADLADSGCGTTEGPLPDASCSDGVDNDGDRIGDFADPDCVSNPEIFKPDHVTNLWLCNTGHANCGNKESGVEELNLPLVLSQAIFDKGPKDGVRQTIGSFEFEVRYDAKLVTVDVQPGDLFAGLTEVTCSSVHREGIVNFYCITKGKLSPAGLRVGPGALAVVHVTPTADVYSILIANQQNGIATQLINQDCQLSDLQGHPIKTDGCGDAALTIRYLEGDIHADCIVDVLDQQQIAFRWGSRLGNLLYNSRMDLEPSQPKKGDGDIDAKDLQFVYGRHGSTCKDPHPRQLPVDPKGKVEPPAG